MFLKFPNPILLTTTVNARIFLKFYHHRYSDHFKNIISLHRVYRVLKYSANLKNEITNDIFLAEHCPIKVLLLCSSYKFAMPI